MDKSQRAYYLREQLRAIQAELTELEAAGNDALQAVPVLAGDTAVTSEVAALCTRVVAAQLPDVVRAKVEQELGRLAGLSASAPEHSVILTYLDWLLSMPWREATEDNIDLAHAAAILAQNHYGLPKAKERILEHIAVRKLAPEKMRTPILCLVGPPGTGKTSMGRSVAQALGRKFVRVTLGGVRDEAEIRGHRRAYVGAMPGRIIQAMRTAGTVNPVVMLDEIDKLGGDFTALTASTNPPLGRDLSAALLDVLDLEQNHEFVDHYLDVPYDLSQVLFIATATLLDPVAESLLDRMELISFAGYTEEEKLSIARQYLIPRQLEQTGLQDFGIVFTEDALRRLIRDYTYEAGVRNLERGIASICRKLARRVAEDKRIPRRIGAGSVADYLGTPKYAFGTAEEQDEIGVATGVAWTEAGGDLVQVEVTLMPGKGNLLLTGQLGEVMQESGQAALSYARSHCAELGIQVSDFDELDIHIHLPEGAIPKDGPSAGITIAVALISALTNRPVRRDLAMTGEITLRGRVLPVGGLKEKAIAAQRAGLKSLVVPKKNEKDLAELPRKIKRQVQLVLVSTMDEVLEQALLPPVITGSPPSSKPCGPSAAEAKDVDSVASSDKTAPSARPTTRTRRSQAELQELEQ